MKGIATAIFLMVCIMFVFAANGQIPSSDTSERRVAKPEQDSLPGDSLKTDSIPSFIVISDTVRTYPFSQELLNRINVRALRKSAKSTQLKVMFEQIAQDYCLYKPKYWSRSVDASVNLTEATFSSNWKSGGLNSIAALVSLSAKTDYERYDVSFTNDLEMQYGSANQKTQGLRKTTDRIYLDSKFAVKIKSPFYLFTAVNFQSQFAPGYNYFVNPNSSVGKIKISALLAPGYLTESLGVEYKPAAYFNVRLGAGAFRQTFVIDTSLYKSTQSNYGVPVGERALTEAALQLVSNYDQDIAKNIHLKALFQFFESYIHSANTSTRLDISFTARVNRMLNVNFTGTALYDRNQDSRIQYTQFLSLGIAYRYADF